MSLRIEPQRRRARRGRERVSVSAAYRTLTLKQATRSVPLAQPLVEKERYRYYITVYLLNFSISR